MRFPLDRLAQRDPEYAEAVRNGLRWKISAWEVKCLYPRVCGLISLARNVGSTISRSENEMQVLLRLHHLSAAHVREDGVPWAEIKKSILRSRPPCAAKIDEMVAFVITKSDGASGQYMQYLKQFHRNGVKASARAGVPAGLYVALGDLRLQYLAMAFLETAWTCPPSGIDKKECNWVSASEVNSMCKAEGELLQRLEVAEHLLADARAYADAFFASAQHGGASSLATSREALRATRL